MPNGRVILSSPTRKELVELQQNIEKVIKGKPEIVRNAIVCVLAQGHLLLEDVPGVGKTTLAQCLARSLNLSFSRIQFTSDMLPSDILGVTLYDQTRREFEFKPGPLFSNVVVADEINRTTPKTQSALLEAMNSAQVSVEKQTYELPQPFIVLATQNPIEFHGTFPLPKSQMDRFMMRLHIGYPALDDEITVLREQRSGAGPESLEAVVRAEDMIRWQADVETVKVDESLLQYLAQIIRATRETNQIVLGASTRGAIALRRAAQARAWMEDRDYCIPDDIKEMVIPVLAHRIQVRESYDSAGFQHEQETRILKHVLAQIEVPL
jgi:MoxR-like ATPase